MSLENVEVVRQHIEAYASGDAERALSFVRPAIDVDISRAEWLDAEALDAVGLGE